MPRNEVPHIPMRGVRRNQVVITVDHALSVEWENMRVNLRHPVRFFAMESLS